MILPLFHLSVVAINLHSLIYDQLYLDYPFPAKGYAEMSFKARSMFLTLWCNVLQTVYFSAAFLNNIAGTDEPSPRKPPLIRVIKDTLFSVAFPTAIYVAAGFWTIYYSAKELIFPEYIDRIMPHWMNLVLHFWVAVFIIIELVATRRNYPTRKVGLTLALAFNIVYTIWMHMLHAAYGAWAYPLFEVLNLPTRFFLILISTVIFVSLYVVGEKISSSSKSKSEANGIQKKKQR